MDVVDLNAGFGARTIISGINLKIEPNSVTALIGPSGCGKSTLLRCLNAMHRTAHGRVRQRRDPARRRRHQRARRRSRARAPARRHGLPAPQPVPDDVDLRQRRLRPAVDIRPRRAATATTRPSSARCARPTSGTRSRIACAAGRRPLGRAAAAALHRARTRRRARGAADGRALLGARPDLHGQDRGDDPQRCESGYTIVIVTHNMQQAARVSDTTAFMTILEAGQPGALVETGPTSEIFDQPTQRSHGRVRVRPVRLGAHGARRTGLPGTAADRGLRSRPPWFARRLARARAAAISRSPST